MGCAASLRLWLGFGSPFVRLPHLDVLRFFVPFLSKVAENSAANKMTIKNLAVVFGPTLLQPPSQDADAGMDAMASMLRDSQPQICATAFLIRNFAAILFSEDLAPVVTRHNPESPQPPSPGATVLEEELRAAEATAETGADGHVLPPKESLIKEWKEEQ